MKAWLAWFLFLPGVVAAEIYRCGNTFSERPCPGARIVRVQPAFSMTPDSAAMPVYLCKAYVGGGRFWSTTHCHRQSATVDRVVNVPRHLPWERQLDLARASEREGRRLATPPQVVQAAGPRVDNRQACQNWEARIRWIDSAARTGGTAAYMEWLNEERRQALAEQSRLRCR